MNSCWLDLANWFHDSFLYFEMIFAEWGIMAMKWACPRIGTNYVCSNVYKLPHEVYKLPTAGDMMVAHTESCHSNTSNLQEAEVPV